jgi:hypothetical protein
MNVGFSGDTEKAYERWLKPELSPELAAQARLDPAIPVQQDDKVSYWIVNARSEGRIVGSMDFDLDGNLQRYETRVTHLEQLRSLPVGTLEMSPAEVCSLAQNAVGPNSLLEGEPKLVAHGAPTKLAWRVLGHDLERKPLSVFVTPQASWAEDATVQANPSAPKE